MSFGYHIKWLKKLKCVVEKKRCARDVSVFPLCHYYVHVLGVHVISTSFHRTPNCEPDCVPRSASSSSTIVNTLRYSWTSQLLYNYNYFSANVQRNNVFRKCRLEKHYFLFCRPEKYCFSICRPEKHCIISQL